MAMNDKNYLFTMSIVKSLFDKGLLTSKEYEDIKEKIHNKYKTKYQLFFED